MRKWMTVSRFCGLPAGCGARQRTLRHRGAEPSHGRLPHAACRQRRSRTIEEDPDADGIADYRVIITDTFDADGNPISTAREEDVEADGIIDARSVTHYDE